MEKFNAAESLGNVSPEEIGSKISQLKKLVEVDNQNGPEFARGIERELTSDDGQVKLKLTEKFEEKIKSLPEYQALTDSEAPAEPEEISEAERAKMLNRINEIMDDMISDWS